MLHITVFQLLGVVIPASKHMHIVSHDEHLTNLAIEYVHENSFKKGAPRT